MGTLGCGRSCAFGLRTARKCLLSIVFLIKATQVLSRYAVNDIDML